jgi:hypothetical protein
MLTSIFLLFQSCDSSVIMAPKSSKTPKRRAQDVAATAIPEDKAATESLVDKAATASPMDKEVESIPGEDAISRSRGKLPLYNIQWLEGSSC